MTSDLTKRLIREGLNKPVIRQDEYGPIRLLAVAEGYAMVRRPRAVPFVMPLGQWEALAVCVVGAERAA